MIETLVYSWWSAPRGLPNADLTLLARLSVLASQRHFKRTLLVTDALGAAWAARELPGLFDHVSTALDRLPTNFARIWALGKLAAAAQMDTPFVHLDFDAFLWSPLPPRLLEAAVCAERPAPIAADEVRAVLGDLPVPRPWRAALATPSPLQLCAGLFGGHDLDTIRAWARASLRLAKRGRGFVRHSGLRTSVVLEQFGLAAFAPEAETLFTCEHPEEAESRRIGYTHLVGAEKRNPLMLARARKRLAGQNFAPRFHVPGPYDSDAYGYSSSYYAYESSYGYADGTSPSEPKLFGLVILTHQAYERHLSDVLASVQKQRGALDEVVLVLNGRIQIPELPPGIRIVRGTWDSPQAARNAGLAAATCQWMCYLDGDNLPTEAFFRTMREAAQSAPATIGILYPGTVLRVTEQTEAQRVFVMPEWNEFEAREKSIADTSSAWRVSALRSVGGWFSPSGMLDDYATALQLVHQGWSGQRVVKAVSVLRHHEGRRSRALETIPATLWHARRHALLTLFAGRERPFQRLLNWYRHAVLPPRTTVHWVDNSGNAAFHARLWRAAKSLGSRSEITGITITRDDRRRTSGSFEAIHSHVASLYNTALRAMDADVLVMIEDDVVPPRDALPALLAPLQPWTSIAAVAAVYPSRHDPRVANVALEKSEWLRMPQLRDLPAHTLWPVGMVAGGCTAWNVPALHRMLPLQISPRLGWDGNLCARLNQAGYLLFLATGIRCAHLCA